MARRNFASPINILLDKGDPFLSTDIVPPTNSESIRRDLSPYIDIVSAEQEPSSSSDIAVTIEPEPSVYALKDYSEKLSCSSPMLLIIPVSDVVSNSRTTDESARSRTVTTFRTTGVGPEGGSTAMHYPVYEPACS